MNDDREKMNELLLSYVGLLAERHSYGPGDGFEYLLWDDLHDDPKSPSFVLPEERDELMYLMTQTNVWVTFNVDTSMLGIIDIDTWRILLEKRGN